jgi:type IV pilus assembly protein PilW
MDNRIGGFMKQEQGFSLVEALLAITISLIVLGGALSAFTDSLKLNEKAIAMSEIEQNLRAGMNYLTADFISAGWGIPIGGIPIPSGVGADAVVRPGPPDAPIGFDSETIAAVNPGPTLGPIVNGNPTDIVNILYADSSLALNAYQLASVLENGSKVTVDPRTTISGANAIHAGDLIYLSNALGGTLQYVTRVTNQIIEFTIGDPMNLNQPGFPGSISQLCGENGVFPPTSATRVYLISYYLEFSPTDPDIPRLIRQINNEPGRVVALVLDNMQLSYDLVDGVVNPTDVKIPVAPNGPSQIRKVNLMVSGRTDAEMRETGDYLRRSLSTQISLRSLSYIDRYR